MEHCTKNGRLRALEIIKSFGQSQFRKETALKKFSEAGIENPRSKFDFLVSNGNIKHKGSLYRLTNK